MSVKRFKFVSPGVFIKEIDNSTIPQGADAIGPVVVGRARRGPGMRPVRINSYSEFVRTFGETVPGNMGGDIYRDGNYQSAMYGTYAAKAFLDSNVAPLTYVRLMGEQTVKGESAGGTAAAGWKTDNSPGLVSGYNKGSTSTNGGAYGLWVFASGSNSTEASVGSWPATDLRAVEQTTASLAAIIYCQNGFVGLSGSIYSGWTKTPDDWESGYQHTASLGALIESDTDGAFNLWIQTGDTSAGGAMSGALTKISFDDNSANFIRKKVNTNPQLKTSQTFYPTSVEKDYWLGESYEQSLRDKGLVTTGSLVGIVYPLALSGTATRGPSNMEGQDSRDAVAGWFIAQDTGPAASYYPPKHAQAFQAPRPRPRRVVTQECESIYREN